MFGINKRLGGGRLYHFQTCILDILRVWYKQEVGGGGGRLYHFQTCILDILRVWYEQEVGGGGRLYHFQTCILDILRVWYKQEVEGEIVPFSDVYLRYTTCLV